MTKIISISSIKRRETWVTKIGQMNNTFAQNAKDIEDKLNIEINKLGKDTLIDHLRLCGNIPEEYGNETSTTILSP